MVFLKTTPFLMMLQTYLVINDAASTVGRQTSKVMAMTSALVILYVAAHALSMLIRLTIFSPYWMTHLKCILTKFRNGWPLPKICQSQKQLYMASSGMLESHIKFFIRVHLNMRRRLGRGFVILQEII